MDQTRLSTEDKNRWEDFRETVRGGMRELRNIGDELARQGRLRMDIYQAERRLRTAFEELGKSVHEHFLEEREVTAGDGVISEIRVRITYYEAEIKRLNEEMQHVSEHQN